LLVITISLEHHQPPLQALLGGLDPTPVSLLLSLTQTSNLHLYFTVNFRDSTVVSSCTTTSRKALLFKSLMILTPPLGRFPKSKLKV